VAHIAAWTAGALAFCITIGTWRDRAASDSNYPGSSEFPRRAHALSLPSRERVACARACVRTQNESLNGNGDRHLARDHLSAAPLVSPPPEHVRAVHECIDNLRLAERDAEEGWEGGGPRYSPGTGATGRARGLRWAGCIGNKGTLCRRPPAGRGQKRGI